MPSPLALTVGDPRGIGPEVMTRAATEFVREDPSRAVVLFGPEGSDPGLDRIDFRGVGPFDDSERGAGAISVAALDASVALAMAGEVAGIVTGPVSKPALHAAGAIFPGQTEFLRDRTGSGEVGMLMASDTSRIGVPLRILLITTHLPLSAVPEALTPALLEERLRLLDRSLRTGWGFPKPRIALCALNPHASDGGLFGDEEARVMSPVVKLLRSDGISVDGPFPADTVFLRLLHSEADAVAVPYHDVGMSVFKTLSFGSGVNVTLGLPFVRTSPDHGTAFGLAGTGKADASSAIAATRLAFNLAERERKQMAPRL